MRGLKIWCTLGVIWMIAALIYGFVFADFFGEAKVLFKYPWFNITLLDFYTGMSLFCAWVIFRERSAAVYVPLIIAFIIIGNPATCFYALVAAIKAKGDWQKFWYGKRLPAT